MPTAVTIKVKRVSSADTGFYYVAKKNSRTMTDKLVKKKYDPVARKHVEFKESRIKQDRRHGTESNGALRPRLHFAARHPPGGTRTRALLSWLGNQFPNTVL